MKQIISDNIEHLTLEEVSGKGYEPILPRLSLLVVDETVNEAEQKRILEL